MGCVTQRSFGFLSDRREADLFELSLDEQFRVTVSNYGASLVGAICPDQDGRLADIVLGCETVAEQARQRGYLGAAIGRVAGRISNASLSLDGQSYALSRNEGRHHLHGGESGFSHRLWRTEPLEEGRCGVAFFLASEDSDQGYPGHVDARLTYELVGPNKLALTFHATSSSPTPFNPTSHTYFNLEGHDAGSIAEHWLQIFAQHHTPTDAELIPIGLIETVASTAFDFSSGKAVATDWNGLERGYDRNFVLNSPPGRVRKAAIVTAPGSGRRLMVATDRPCIHLYTGGWLDIAGGKGGAHYGPFGGLSLETQGFPDALNHPGFPSEILVPGQPFKSQTIFQFETEKTP